MNVALEGEVDNDVRHGMDEVEEVRIRRDETSYLVVLEDGVDVPLLASAFLVQLALEVDPLPVVTRRFLLVLLPGDDLSSLSLVQEAGIELLQPLAAEQARCRGRVRDVPSRRTGDVPGSFDGGLEKLPRCGGGLRVRMRRVGVRVADSKNGLPNRGVQRDEDRHFRLAGSDCHRAASRICFNNVGVRCRRRGVRCLMSLMRCGIELTALLGLLPGICHKVARRGILYGHGHPALILQHVLELNGVDVMLPRNKAVSSGRVGRPVGTTNEVHVAFS